MEERRHADGVLRPLAVEPERVDAAARHRDRHATEALFEVAAEQPDREIVESVLGALDGTTNDRERVTRSEGPEAPEGARCPSPSSRAKLSKTITNEHARNHPGLTDHTLGRHRLLLGVNGGLGAQLGLSERSPRTSNGGLGAQLGLSERSPQTLNGGNMIEENKAFAERPSLASRAPKRPASEAFADEGPVLITGICGRLGRRLARCCTASAR